MIQILKDIRNRFEMLRGRQVHYIPGWDCHGLPIELKALGEVGTSGLSPLQIRQKGKKCLIDELNTSTVQIAANVTFCSVSFSAGVR